MSLYWDWIQHLLPNLKPEVHVASGGHIGRTHLWGLVSIFPCYRTMVFVHKRILGLKNKTDLCIKRSKGHVKPLKSESLGYMDVGKTGICEVKF